MDTVTCPHCGTGAFDPTRIVNGFATCDRCGHQAAVTFLGEQVWLERQERQLQARLGWVRQQVLAGAPPMSTGPVVPVQGPRSGSAGVQGLLLGTGAVLLVAAAAVFVAVTWDLLGPAGQLSTLGLVVVALSAGAYAARNRYRGTAEALASVAACVTVVALLAAPALGLVTGWWRAHGSAWATVAFGLTAALGVAMVMLSGLIAWRVTVVAALLATAQSAVFASGGGSDVPIAAPVVLAAVTVALLRPRPTPTRFDPELRWLAGGSGLLALVNGLAGYDHPDDAAWWSLTWLIVAGCGVAVAGPGNLIAALSTGQPPVQESPVQESPVQESPVQESPVQQPHIQQSPAQQSSAQQPSSRSALAQAGAAGTVVLTLALGQALVFAVRAFDLTPSVGLAVLALCGALLLATAIFRPLLLPGVIGAGSVWLVSLPVMADDGAVVRADVAIFLALVALSGYLLSLWPRRGVAAWPAAACGTVAAWVGLSLTPAENLELYTGSSAGLLLIAGLLHRRGTPQRGSWETLGPALAMAALPSALVAFGEAGADDEGPLRAVLVLLGGASLAATGAVLRVRAAFLIGLVAALIAGLGQLFALAQLLPRWIALAAGGALLLGTGFAAEVIRTAGRQFRAFTGQMR
jgi:hypothetical protein